MLDNYSDASKMLTKMRKLTESCKRQKTLLNEEGGVQIPEKAIAITDDPKFGEKVLTKQKEHFRSAVDSGVEFSRPDDNNPSESPLIYMPSTGNIVFSGTIPSLGNLKWQFVLKNNTGNGCFVWSDELILNKDNLRTLSKLHGYYENWKSEWQNSAEELEQLKNLEK
jgi:hypothetical protein